LILKDIFLLPNLITLSRLFITIYIFFTYKPDEFSSFNLILLIAIIGISDSIDGIVARKFNLVSKLGIILDPVTDRIVFILLIFWLVSYFNIIFLVLLLIREILVSIGGLYIIKTEKTVNVSNKGKAGTALIFISLCLSVLDPALINVNSSLFLKFVDFFLIFSIFFYYFVALEYLYKLINKK
tara:strand:+ start:201 stop:749 length:549 start_codon:yes stop_codon:yes gene_type:complete